MVSQVDALRKTVATMNLGDEHAALVAYCEGLAEIIDEHPDRAALWREYRPAVAHLLALGEAGSSDGEAAVLELMRSAVRDSEESGAGDARPGGRGDGPRSGSTPDAVAAASRGRRSRASA